MENLIDQDETPDSPEVLEEIKVIAIKLSFDLQERILSFPFLHAIRAKYPEADLHFITPKKEIEVLNLLPFKAYYHEFDEDEIQNVFDVHRYCATIKIYNVDLFISLTNSFADACLGLGLRAKKRLGFSDNWKTLVLTHKTKRPVGHHIVEDQFSLFKELDGDSVNTRMKVMSRDLAPIIPEWDVEPYMAINLSPLRSAMIEKEWLELISMFEGQRIILFASEEPVKVQMIIDPFLAMLPKSNTYLNFTYKNWIELGRMLAYARGIITYSGALAAMASYVGSKTLILYENEDPQITGPFYNMADISLMTSSNPTLINPVKETSGSLLPRKTFNMSEVSSQAYDFFKLK